MNNTKRLTRNVEDGMLGGVCAGLADYFQTDPSVVRILWMLLYFAGGIGFWAYILAWIIIPENKDDDNVLQ